MGETDISCSNQATKQSAMRIDIVRRLINKSISVGEVLLDLYCGGLVGPFEGLLKELINILRNR